MARRRQRPCGVMGFNSIWSTLLAYKTPSKLKNACSQDWADYTI